MSVKLYIENQLVETNENVTYAITKQFEDLTNPTDIINDWSKTVNIPFTEKNNELFGHIYNPDKVVVAVPDNLLLNMRNNEEIWQNDNIFHTDKEYPINYGHPEILYPPSLYKPYFPGTILSTLTSYSVVRGTNSTTYETFINQSTQLGKQSFGFTLTSGMTGAQRCITFKVAGTTTSVPPLIPYVIIDLSGFTDGNYNITFDTVMFDTDLKQFNFKNIVLAKSNFPVWANNMSVGIYFDPLRKLDFRLEWDNNVIMTGYAKMNEVKQEKGTGTYELTLFGQLGRLFQEMKKITFDESSADTDYIIDGGKYVNEEINKELVYSSWTSTGQTTDELIESGKTGYNVTDIIGFAPNNSFSEDFDYKAFQSSATGSTKFTDVLGTGFTEDTGISPDTAIPDGMLPREIGEFRSYLQLPFIYFNKLFKVFQEKAEAITGYHFDLDSEWFNKYNPYWYKLVYMLKNLSTLKNDTYRNTYIGSGSTSCVDPSDTSKQWRYDFSPVSDYIAFNPSLEHNSILAPDHKHFVFPSNSVVNGTMNIHIKFQVATNLGSTQTLKIRGNGVFLFDLFATDGTNNTRIGRICYKDPNTSYYASESDYVVDVPSKEIPAGAYTWVLSDRDYTFQIPSTNFNEGEMAFYWNLWGYNAETMIEGASMFVNSNPSTVILGDLTTIAGVNDLYLSTTPLVGRSYSRVTLNTMWDNDYNVFEQILNYCKMYRIGVSVDNLNKKILFMPIYKYFQNYTVNNWTDKIDKTKDFKVTPITFENKYVLFNYEDSDTKLGDEYRTKYGYDFGEYRLTTEYNFNEDTNELFEGINGSMVNTDNSLSWNTLYDHRIIYSMPAEITVYCKDDDRKYVDTFGQYYFHNGLAYWSTEGGLDMRSVNISDDSMLQQGANTFFYVQSQGPIIGCTSYPFLDIVYGDNMCLFNVPMKNYTYLQNYSGKKSLFKNLWENYINERYNVQNKKITCYVDISPLDYNNFEYNHFVKVGNQLCMVNKIYDYDITSNDTTKVDLITIQNISGYTDDTFIRSIDTLTLHLSQTTYINGEIHSEKSAIGTFDSLSDVTFDNGTTSYTSNGVVFTISGNTIYYQTNNRYVDKADLDFNVTLKNSHYTATFAVERYSIYPYPYVSITDANDNVVTSLTKETVYMLNWECTPTETIANIPTVAFSDVVGGGYITESRVWVVNERAYSEPSGDEYFRQRYSELLTIGTPKGTNAHFTVTLTDVNGWHDTKTYSVE